MSGDKAAGSDQAVALTWEVRLWEKEPQKRYAVLCCAALSALSGWWLFNSVLMALLGFAVICGATTDFWLPLRYKLTDTEASLRCGFSASGIEWVMVKRVIEGEDGVKLSPLAESGRLSPFRGVFLRYSGNRETVLEYIRQSVGEECSISGEKN